MITNLRMSFFHKKLPIFAAVFILISSVFASFGFVRNAYAIADGSLVKTAGASAVYFVFNNKRYAFPSQGTYYSWYSNFYFVETVSPEALAALPLAGNVTYRPGFRMLKISSDPKVYAVSRFGVLHWIQTADVANALYGVMWNKQIDDISDAFFVNYTVGAPISQASDYSVLGELKVISFDENIVGGNEPSSTNEDIAHVGSCQIFPADNAWNTVVSGLPVDPKSDAYMASIGLSNFVHPDFGSNRSYGMPANIVSAGQQKVPVTFLAYANQSDPGPYPIPPNAAVESGPDAHLLVVDKDACRLYEMYNAKKTASGWSADAGAVWNLNSNALRPKNWTSADAAGLPIYPGLAKFDEANSGVITHALRFTAPRTQNGYVSPATHEAGIANSNYPPMGLRVRLKASFDTSKFTGQSKAIAEALKKYGMILADNGSSWYISGQTDSRWNDADLHQLKSIPGSAFEAVYAGPITIGTR